MKHPLLRNPAKWLRGVEKGHSSSLYQETFYDPQLLAANPFARALVSTRKDVSGTRFPLGNMTQVVVQKEGDLDYILVPVLEKPTKGQNPASYVVTNQAYLEFVSQRHFKPIPLKYRHRSPAIANSIKVAENFVQRVDSMLLERIQNLLEDQHRQPGHSQPGRSDRSGIMVSPSPTISGWWEDGTYNISGPFFTTNSYVSYVDHKQLCDTLTKYVRFKTVTSTRTSATQMS